MWLLVFSEGEKVHEAFHRFTIVDSHTLSASLRCTENLMTSTNLATVFAPCLLPPPNKAEMSEVRLELRVVVLRTFIEEPRLFGNKPLTLLTDPVNSVHTCSISVTCRCHS